jgi:hydroxyethylthiazole kinase
MPMTASETTTLAPGAAMARMRAAVPLVQCITNYVAMSTAANVVLAAGASPAMVHAAEEVGEFTPMAGALTVNIGTLSGHWIAGMVAAAEAANAAGTPWVLDPVAHFISAFRRETTARLMALQPAIVRANASEAIALAGAAGMGKGADAGDTVAAAEAPARALARSTGAVVAVTGEVDFVTDGERAVRITGGHPTMPRVTALGCGLTALTGAYAAVTPDALEAAAAACAHYAAAGELAGRGAPGPGSFAVAFLDALAAVGPEDLAGRVVAA